MSIKGLPFIGKMNEFINQILYATINKTGNSKASLDVRSVGYYKYTAVPVVVEAGSDDNIVNLTAHGAQVGDLFRIVTTANSIKEYDMVIDEIVSANQFKLAGFLSANLATGDTFDILKPIFEQLASDGSSMATVTSPPIQYNRKAAGVTTATTVLEDLDSPTSSRGLPVVIHSIDGAPINITAGDISISTSHINDSMAIGDGTNLVGVTANNEFKTHDADILTKLTNVVSTNNATTTPLAGAGTYTGTFDDMLQYEAIMFALSVDRAGTMYFEFSQDGITVDQTQGYAITVVTPGVAEGQVFQVMREARYVRVRYLNGATAQAVFKIQAILAVNASAGEVQAISQTILANSDAIVTKGVIYGVTTGGGGGYVAVKVTPSGALAVESTSAQLPTVLGQTTMAGSTSVTIASDQSVLPVEEEDNTTSGNITTLNLNPTGAATAGSAVEIDCSGKSTVTMQLTGTFTGTFAPEYTVDGTTWVALVGNIMKNAVTGSNVGSTTAAGIFKINCTGMVKVRIQAIAVVTGTAVVTMRASKGEDLVSDALAETMLVTMNSNVVAMSAKLPATLGQKTMANSMSVTLASDQSTNGLATETKQDAEAVLIGAVNETAPASDTANSGLNGRLQRIAQNISSMIALLPAALGQGTMAQSLRVVLASDQSTLNTKQAALTGTHAQSLVIDGTTAVTITAPAGAKKAKIMAIDTNTVALRVTADGATTATATIGMQFQPGRSEDYDGVGNISVIAESVITSQGLIVHWSA